MSHAALPDAIHAFLDAAVTPGEMTLPFHYSTPERWEAQQRGFRVHGITGENLTASRAGEWQPGWYVIALNGFDDPFFIDSSESAQGFPVYYAPHGAGRWNAERIAPTLASFSERLLALRDAADDDAAFLQYLDTLPDAQSPFWSDVRSERLAREEEEDLCAPPDPAAWQQGRLVITATGPQKLKVIHLLRKTLNLPLSEVMAFVAQLPIVAGEDFHIRLRPLEEALVALGASVEFQPDGPRLKTFQLDAFFTLEELIDCVKSRQETDTDYAIYSASEEPFQAGEQVFIAGPETGEDDPLTFQVDGVTLHYAYAGDQFRSVVELAIEQKPEASAGEIIRALNHYSEYDDFLDME
ncbi:hypothetical protein [Superficieibacter sp. HKU1]|uniref:DUF7716 domain-containing protein n=1 Tax=Superficieibacter sp. HKU1 TaxID=3031919 RepID=UPI0023E2ADDE|nr:hypothetical protein [Superficieibacter sp. HKU1]WES66525.1 hypothetical protein P0H77_12650 [Superficieibacter sp. HKU1]